MNLATVISIATGGQLTTLLRLMRLLEPVYRASFLAGAAAHGVLRRLADGPASLDELLGEPAPPPAGRAAFEAWLDFGVRLGELERTPRGYRLRGALARALAALQHDSLAALLEEVVRLHARFLSDIPARARAGRLYTLADQDGPLVARSSRVLEPFVFEAVDDFVPPRGKVRLLEVGCGSGTYIRHAAARNPDLIAVGLEMQAEVAAAARKNLADWGLAARVTVEVGDVRQRPAAPDFDLVTLHNNIYYFPVEERIALLERVRGMLRPGGRVLLTTGCQGGGYALEMLNLWAVATEGCGRLPSASELVGQLGAAGFQNAAARHLVPVESYYAFTAAAP